MSWGNDLTLHFMELYKDEPVIWDTNNPLHKSRPENNEAWNRIRLAMHGNFKVEELKKKKESLMASYRLHKRKALTNPKYCISWFCFPLMDSFLRPFYEDSNGDNEDDTSSKSYNIVPKIEYVRIPESSKQSKPSYQVENRPAKRPYLPANPDNESSEEFELYCKLLVKKLKKLNERQRDVAMHEIDNIIFRIKTQDFSEKQSHIITISPIIRNNNSQGGSMDNIILEEDPMPTQQDLDDDE